jgi:hypothetical protein
VDVDESSSKVTTPLNDRYHAYRAARRAAAYLRDSISASGSVREKLLGDRLDPVQLLARIENFCDVWHTVTTLLTLRLFGWSSTPAAQFVITQVLETGGVSHTSTRPGLCTETTAAAALAVPELRERFRDVLRRSALPGGRWATFILDQPGGYDLYMCGPSATGWVLAMLCPDDPLVPAARRYLLESRGPSSIWQTHDYAYGTPFYPAHLCARWLPSSDDLLRYCSGTIGPSGAWGFGEPPIESPSVLPTALALLTVLSVDPALERARSVALAATRWLIQAQAADGSFPLIGTPPPVWYLGRTFTTAIAAQALFRVANAATLDDVGLWDEASVPGEGEYERDLR